MRLLLDTHALLWFDDGDARMPPRVRRIISDPRNELMLSAVSAYEIAVKFASRKLVLPENPQEYLRRCAEQLRLGLLPISFEHSLSAGLLSPHHGDPFDRMLIAQSIAEHLPLITSDLNIQRYDVATIW